MQTIDIFKHTNIGGINFKNRILRAATYEGYADEMGNPTHKMKDCYSRLARGGAGGIITGYTAIMGNGKSSERMAMIDSSERIPAFKALTSALQEYQTPLILQIVHGGGLAKKGITGTDLVAPSRKKYSFSDSIARELDDREIKIIIDCFVNAIIRARMSGFNGVELHAAHGYLLYEFLSPTLNRRTDRWGGTPENRFRIIREIIEQARKKVERFPIWAKISAYDADRRGMKLEDGIRVAEMLQKSGIDAIEVSCGSGNDGFNSIRMSAVPSDAIMKTVPDIVRLPLWQKRILRLLLPLLVKNRSPLLNYNVEAAAAIKKHVDIPVIVVGGIRKLDDIITIIRKGDADCVSMSRPFIREPNLVNKFIAGTATESECHSCGYCLLGVRDNPLHCYNGVM